jgi:integrase
MMAKVELPFLDKQKDRNGKVTHWYFRRGGRRWPLRGEPGSPEFMEDYWRLRAATTTMPAPSGKSRAYPPGSFGAVVNQYFASPKFRNKKPNTQKLYRLILEPLVELHGHKPIGLLQRQHIWQWFIARSDTPGMANMLVKVLRLLMKYAVLNFPDYVKHNPVHDIDLHKLGEHRAWTDEECAAFEARWPSGTMQRRAYLLAKFTGQRCSDVANMVRAHRKDGFIRVEEQQKTGTPLWIPEHRDLTAELALGSGHMSLLTRADGRAFDSNSLGLWFAHAIELAGLPDACVMHGLRKTAARMLAEVGCSEHEIASITGHKSLAEIQRYTKAADQKRMATAAIHRLEQNGNRTATAKRTSGGTAKQSVKD